MSTDVYKQVLNNNGEGLTQDDLNDMQRFLRAQMFDANLQYLIGSLNVGVVNATHSVTDMELGGQTGANALTKYAYALTPGGAYLKMGSGNNKVAIAPGTLLQKVGTTDGNESTLLAYTFTGAEEFTVAAGDGANPRVDLLQMKLEYVDGDSQTRDFEDATTRIVTTTTPNKKRRVQCTLLLKTGTPAASPTVPNTDSGYVPVGLVVVGTSYLVATAVVMGEDTAGANAVVHDLRMPLRVRAYRVDPSLFKLVTAWALSNSNSTVTSSNATNDLYVPCPAGIGRIVGVAINTPGSVDISGTITLGRSANILTTSFVTRNTLNVAQGGPQTNKLWTFPIIQALGHAPNAGPTVIVNSDNVGPPIWTTGRRSLNEQYKFTLGPPASNADCAALRIQSGVNTHVIGAVTFYIAEGI